MKASLCDICKKYLLAPSLVVSIGIVNPAHAHDDQAIYNKFIAERFEYEGNDNLHLFKWDIQDWAGNDDGTEPNSSRISPPMACSRWRMTASLP